MATYTLREARTQLSKLLHAAQRGEEVVITRYGKPIAQLVAITTPQTKRRLGFYPIKFTSDLTEK